MRGLLSEAQVHNPNADEPWKKSERDAMLDRHFAGCPPIRNAQITGRNPKAIIRRLEQYTNNERGMAEDYVPFRRTSRQGKRFTENEQLIIRAHKQRQVPVTTTALLLGRKADEIEPPVKPAHFKASREFVPTLDIILALRYIFYVYEEQYPGGVVSNKVYDDLVTEECEYGKGEAVLQTMLDPKDCPRRIKSLALYLTEKFDEREGEK